MVELRLISNRQERAPSHLNYSRFPLKSLLSKLRLQSLALFNYSGQFMCLTVEHKERTACTVSRGHYTVRGIQEIGLLYGAP